VEPHDNNAPITSYEVIYMEPAFVTGERNVVVNAIMEMVTISNLYPGVNYTFTVRALNEIGNSPTSDPLTVRTLEEGKSLILLHFPLTLSSKIAVPGSSPENVTAIAESSTEIMVSWDIVSSIDQNGIITVYEVLYQSLETFGEATGSQTRNVSGSDMTIQIMDLEEFVNYSISVRAYTSVGAGPYSDVITITTQEDGIYGGFL